jgi:hypothetical protein
VGVTSRADGAKADETDAGDGMVVHEFRAEGGGEEAGNRGGIDVVV